jgi:recombination protein RecA
MAQNNKWLTMMMKDEKNLIGSLVKARERVLTASPSLNWALSGGFYKGYASCVYGPEGAGKSLVSMMAIGALQKADPEAIAVVITTEMRAPTPERLLQLGVDPSRTLFRMVNTLHDVFDWITSTDEKFVNSDGTKGGPGMSFMIEQGAPIKALVIDSIKGIRGPKEQNIDTVEKDFMGDLSKFLNPSLKSILEVIRKNDIMTIFVQQVNMNMDADEVKYQGKKYLIPSGQSLKHFCESMMLVTRVESKDSKMFDETMHSIRDLPVQRGHTVRVKVEKDNLNAPFREAEFQIDYSQGVVNTGLEIAKLAVGLNVISHPLNDKGAPIAAQWLFGTKKWIGFANAVKEIEADLGLQDAIMDAIDDYNKKPTEAK